jgi:enamine deaminase RidA (YjgF/YER057c/UK114 family)
MNPPPSRPTGPLVPVALLAAVVPLLSGCTPRAAEGDVRPAQAVAEPAQRVDAEQRIRELGIELRPIGTPTNTFLTAVRVRDMLYLSGRGPVRPEGGFVTGKLGSDLTVQAGYDAARLTGIDLLSALKAELGDLNRVERIVKVLGVVNATPDFTEHPMVINGFSDLMVEVFGEHGRHARSALGMGSLPYGIPVEIEMIVQLREPYE